jgi:hypothetical protein
VEVRQAPVVQVVAAIQVQQELPILVAVAVVVGHLAHLEAPAAVEL